jgi:hypothetical protein
MLSHPNILNAISEIETTMHGRVNRTHKAKECALTIFFFHSFTLGPTFGPLKKFGGMSCIMMGFAINLILIHGYFATYRIMNELVIPKSKRPHNFIIYLTI